MLVAFLRFALVLDLMCYAKFTRQADFPSESILCLGRNETIYSEKLCLGVEETVLPFTGSKGWFLSVVQTLRHLHQVYKGTYL